MSAHVTRQWGGGVTEWNTPHLKEAPGPDGGEGESMVPPPGKKPKKAKPGTPKPKPKPKAPKPKKDPKPRKPKKGKKSKEAPQPEETPLVGHRGGIH